MDNKISITIGGEKFVYDKTKYSGVTGVQTCALPISNYQNSERPPQTQQPKQDEKAEKYSAGKGTDKCPPNQTKKEEIGSLNVKEFRIMIAKMIQNLENRMELQINNPETRIEKMQEMFNKNLEEIKKSQSIMNNAIAKIKSTLEGTNSIITEAEDRISEVEYRMVAISEAEWKKEKRIKRNEDNLRDLWDNDKCPTFES